MLVHHRTTVASLATAVALAVLLAPPLPGRDRAAEPMPGAAHAQPPRSTGPARSCLRTLDRLGVRYKRTERPGIAIAVEVLGELGGVHYRGYRKRPLVLDCSLVVSLAVVGRDLTRHGITRATYSSAYQRRNVRGSNRPSRHSYGLALDIHELTGDELGTLRVIDDYEQGLGDDADCIGRPLTRGGAILRALSCRFTESGLFRIVLSPDTDAAHHNHFHLEALPWTERSERPGGAVEPR
ncbi:MAG: extensin family protein [Myxococcota bacterium]